MNINQVFSGASFVKEDFPHPHTLTIQSVGMKTFDDGKSAIELQFVGENKTLICNKTNAQLIASQHGPETDHWIGKQITLYCDPTVSFGGNIVGGIRVQVAGMQVQMMQQQPNHTVPNVNTNDIPF